MNRNWIFIHCAICLLLPYIATTTANTSGQSTGKNDSISAQFLGPEEKATLPRYQRKRLVELAPQCKNFLKTVLNGKWVPKTPPAGLKRYQKNQFWTSVRRKKLKVQRDMESFWIVKGIPANPWHSTKYCGYYRRQKRLTDEWPDIGTWCDPKSSRPCCDNAMSGVCVSAPYGSCTCSNCVDIRRLRHAEVMDWKSYDYRCKWRRYSASEACDVIESSSLKKLYYVGDSFMQSMYLGLLQILSNKPITGGWKKTKLSWDDYKKCSNYAMNYHKQCRNMTESMNEMRYKDALCGDGRNVSFRAEFRKYYNNKFWKQFRNLISGLAGKPGTYVVVGIGFHIQLDLKRALRGFMEPAVRERRNYYEKSQIPLDQRWPKMYFAMPMLYGLLKPTKYVPIHHKNKQIFYKVGMSRYCKNNGIEMLDFNPLTKNVHSFDGVHYGVRINFMKNQMFLNHIASRE